MDDEEFVLNYFFTNTKKPIFCLKNMPEQIKNYIYVGVSRFPNVRERFLKLLKDKGVFKDVLNFIKEGKDLNKVLKKLIDFADKRNNELFFKLRHYSGGEGSSVFVVSEENPIYATEIQQDFYFPMTTMEYSTRYGRKFNIDKMYKDPELMKSEFASEAEEIWKKNFELYKKGFDILMECYKKKKSKEELSEKVSVLDSLRFLIPIAAHTTIILGGNSRAVIEHFRKLLTYEDNFIKEYVKNALKELSKVIPGFFSNLEPDKAVIEREKRLRKYAEELFKKKFIPVKEDIKMFYEFPTEELVLTQILYPYCNVPFEVIYDKVSSLTLSERNEIFRLATAGRKNRTNPIRGFETRPIVFELETPWAFWKDFKRNRMNLRFQQEMRGLSGFDVPELIAESELRKEYESAMKKTSELIEKVYRKYGGKLSKTVAAQGSRKRYLLCMGVRQLTVLTELRTCGEGDRGYRKIASKMIELAKERNPRLFGHIHNNYKNQ